MRTTLWGHGYPDIGLSGLCGQPSVGADIRTLGTQGYVDSPLRIRISGYWSLRAMWTTLCGHGYPDIGHSGLCGQPSVGTDIRTLGTQGYVDSPLQRRIFGYWSLRAVSTTLCGHGYTNLGMWLVGIALWTKKPHAGIGMWIVGDALWTKKPHARIGMWLVSVAPWRKKPNAQIIIWLVGFAPWKLWSSPSFWSRWSRSLTPRQRRSLL